jgi:hypothetical protein
METVSGIYLLPDSLHFILDYLQSLDTEPENGAPRRRHG